MDMFVHISSSSIMYLNELNNASKNLEKLIVQAISNKDIWRDSKKYCIICENECIGDGIQIINNFICNKCIERMNLIDVGSDEYEIIKNKIKNSIADKIIKNK